MPNIQKAAKVLANITNKIEREKELLRNNNNDKDDADCSSDDEDELIISRQHSLMDNSPSSSSSSSSGLEDSPETTHKIDRTTCRMKNNNNGNDNNNTNNSENKFTNNRKRCAPDDHSQPYAWDEFCRKGTRLKTFLDDAVQKVVTEGLKDTPIVSTAVSAVKLPPIPRPVFPGRKSREEHSAVVARQKTSECIRLQKQLKEAYAETAALKATNDELRDAANASALRMERSTQALKVATQNAANARADADAAEVAAASLATQLQAFQTVVDETKQASKVLFDEHQQIAATAREIETKYVQTEAELARSKKEITQAERRVIELQTHADKLEDDEHRLKQKLDKQESEMRQLKQSLTESQALEQAHVQRTERIEKELQAARDMLVKATSAAAESEAAACLLKDTIKELQTANEGLHQKLREHGDKARIDQERLQETLGQVEQENQQLKRDATKVKEEISSLTRDKATQEAQIAQLQTRISTLQKQLKDANTTLTWTNATTPTNSSRSSTVSPDETEVHTPSFSIPPLSSRGKENSPMPSSSSKCSICFKSAVGIMKPCQCGKKGCEFRAHATCVHKIQAGPSVSHPCTPAKRLPIILCGRKASYTLKQK